MTDNVIRQEIDKLTRALRRQTSIGKLNFVRRWKTFFDTAIKRQTVLEHVLSLTKLVRHCSVIMNTTRQPENQLDELLLVDAALLHDDGEGILETDFPATSRQAFRSVNEYLAFVSELDKENPTEYKRCLRAFLLQFCFNEEIKKLLQAENGNTIDHIVWLEQNRRDEALLFEGLEKIEYILFGIKQFLHRNILDVAVSTIDHHLESLDKICQELPEFKLIWTDDLRDSCIRLSKMYPNVRRR
jgi:hypothetical protein